MSESLLYTARDGAPQGAPFLVLHDRFGSLDDARTLGRQLGDDKLRIAVRGPRVQTAGGGGTVAGYYWYFGPVEKPELSTLGDGLYQLERLLLETCEKLGQEKVGLLGHGEGGVVAVLTAMIWPERIASVIAIDAPMPVNLDQIPFDRLPLDGLQVTFVDDQQTFSAASAEKLKGLGAKAQMRTAATA